MIAALEELKSDSAEGKDAFLRAGLVQKAVLLDLIHLTESADKLSPGFKKLNSSIAWVRMARLRNQGLVHDYAQVDLTQVWSFVRDDLVELRRQLNRVKFPRESEVL